jgi:cytochrome c oxidase subunit 2
MGPGTALADLALNMTEGVTPIRRQVHDLHMLVLWACLILGAAVFVVLIYSIIHHRKSRGAVAPHFHESTAVEVIWTVIPFVVLVAVAVPATRTLLAL